MNKTRFNIAYALIAVMAVLSIQDWVRTTQSVAVIPYSQFQKLLLGKIACQVEYFFGRLWTINAKYQQL